LTSYIYNEIECNVLIATQWSAQSEKHYYTGFTLSINVHQGQYILQHFSEYISCILKTVQYLNFRGEWWTFKSTVGA